MNSKSLVAENENKYRLINETFLGKLQIDGEDVPGIQQLDFKIVRNRQNKGAPYVEGMLKLRASYDKLDKKLYEKPSEIKSFHIRVDLYGQESDQSVRKITFDECYLDSKSFGINTNGVAETTYEFSATRVRED